MNILKDTCIDFFKNEDMKKDMKEMMTPIFNLIYNEIYVYIWVIAIYNIFFMFILLGMFFLLIRLLHRREPEPFSHSNTMFSKIIPEIIEELLSEVYKKNI